MYSNNIVLKTKTTLLKKSSERHHNSTVNQLEVIAHLEELLIKIVHLFFIF
jgi:hypothetical protein